MRRLTLALAAGLALLLATTAVGAGSAATEARLAYNAIPIGGGLYLGGFSDLYSTSSSANDFYSVTDRGPNKDGCTGTVFPLPDFPPEILRLVAGGTNLNVVKRTDLTVGGNPVSGLPARTDGKNGTAYADDAPTCTNLGYDPNGADPEGIVTDPRDNSHWISEEYLPSVMHVSKDGEILSRIIPAGNLSIQAPGLGVPSTAAFPAIVGSKFRTNRGFEGLAISPDGKTLYTLLQSAMQNPGSSTNASRAVRVFKLDVSDPSNPTMTAEWVYRLDGTASPAVDRRISALVYAGADKLIVEELDDVVLGGTDFTTLYLTDFTGADNILGSSWDSTATSPTLEQNFMLATATTYGPGNSCDKVPAVTGPKPGCKFVWFDIAAALDAAGLVNGKIEGVAIVQPGRTNNVDPSKGGTVAVINDNDFNIDGTANDEKLQTVEK